MIEFDSVTKAFPDGTTAVEDLDLTIPSDGTTVIVGPSGCGKTTTLRMINRMLDPSSGSIRWDGTDIADVPVTRLRRQMGYVIQSGGLFPHKTVAENIGTVPRLIGWDARRISARTGELMELVDLDPALAKRYPAQLSGGQQQRVGVARALAADPVLLLMDEPFSAVDPLVRGDLQQMVKRLNTDLGKTIVLITHDIDEAITLGDEVVVMQRPGHVAQQGTPAQILTEPANPFVDAFVGKDRGYRALTFLPAGELDLTPADGPPPEGARTFPLSGSARVALDETLLSTDGRAYALDEGGRAVGMVGVDAIVAAADRQRALIKDS
ncbi:ABC-type proline/glycine betaine transport system ATPase subunit [Naumannella cuiyingiana]|uniref:ABC-type quaternary amine transporter n=1 Tax=Naumannella cuiyingiana TaxID=1347891 RepID=A0A7Z0D894_9ACTN|nr:ABC-type proline/glycine betaine transport system ATPase subunit [Naumannella cuiyingiana]